MVFVFFGLGIMLAVMILVVFVLMVSLNLKVAEFLEYLKGALPERWEYLQSKDDILAGRSRFFKYISSEEDTQNSIVAEHKRSIVDIYKQVVGLSKIIVAGLFLLSLSLVLVHAIFHTGPTQYSR